MREFLVGARKGGLEKIMLWRGRGGEEKTPLRRKVKRKKKKYK